MKLWKRGIALLGVVAAFGVAMTLHAATMPIANSKHNMNQVFGPNTIKENQICLPCHTPHNQPDKTMGYLWNHVMPNFAGYQLYGTGAEYVGLDEASKMCLSCHDGTVAVDSYGDSGSIHTGTKTLGVATDAAGNSTAGFVIGGGTGDLRHDHPVGVEYPGLSADGKTWTVTRGFKDPTKFSKSAYSGAKELSVDPVTGYKTYESVKYVDTTGATISAVGGGSIILEEGNVVGCVACHTPHTSTYNFLHVPNINSQLCLTCHDK